MNVLSPLHDLLIEYTKYESKVIICSSIASIKLSASYKTDQIFVTFNSLDASRFTYYVFVRSMPA